MEFDVTPTCACLLVSVCGNVSLCVCRAVSAEENNTDQMASLFLHLPQVFLFSLFLTLHTLYFLSLIILNIHAYFRCLVCPLYKHRPYILNTWKQSVHYWTDVPTTTSQSTRSHVLLFVRWLSFCGIFFHINGSCHTICPLLYFLHFHLWFYDKTF